jgi:FlaG/FlaF family flagellin (archaellin)
MKNIMKNRKALSTVVTTLIILVVSVLLAGVVTYFAINVTSTRVQQESLNLMYNHVWYSVTDSCGEAALVITNTGGRDVVLDNVAVRGQAIALAQLYYYYPSAAPTSDLTYAKQTPRITGSPVTISGGGGAGTYTEATSSITLSSGKTVIIYMVATTTASPGSVSSNDVGLTIAISVFTSQATYYKECNVEGMP